MVLKMQSFVFVLLLAMLSSGVVSGVDNPISLITDLYAYKSYDGTKADQEKPNLFIGGISQTSSNADHTEMKWRNFADQNDAIFVPTYYKGTKANPVQDGLAVNSAAKSEKSEENGLVRDELNGYSLDKPRQYGTIIGYSGGTTTVVTAMAEQGIRADTLVLISPMMGWSPFEKFDWQGEFEKKIQKIMELNPGIKIVVLQSSDDTPTLGSKYQYKFPDCSGGICTDESNHPMSSWFSEIEVHNVKLEKSGNEGHKDFFDTYAMNNIKDGLFVEPKSEPKLPLKKEFLATWQTPLISPTSDTSELSAQNKEGTDETSGTSYVNKARDDLWLIDMFFDPSFINKIEHFNPAFDWAEKPPVPMYLPSGEQNTYGYDFIYLPGIEDYFTDTYLNWVATYLNSIGGGDNGGYGGLLLDEDRSGEDGW